MNYVMSFYYFKWISTNHGTDVLKYFMGKWVPLNREDNDLCNGTRVDFLQGHEILVLDTSHQGLYNYV